ncbi:MAG: hypothetical protein P8J87_03730, partial [Verrucomicrobiales bacterium]|nr:hypothetical protein [Verrucomicrobiales bacterium]
MGGTLWGGVRIESMDYSGGEILPVLKVGEAGVSYDLWELLRDGGLKWLKEVRLKDAEVELVLEEKAGEDEDDEEAAAADAGAGELPDFWDLAGLVLDIENVNFRMTQGGKVTVVEGVTLKHDGVGGGRLEIAKLELPNGVGREGIGTEIHTGAESLTLGPLRIFDAVEVTALTLHKEPGDGAMVSAKLDLAGGVVVAEATQALALKLELESGAIDVPELMELAEVDGLGSGLVDVLEIGFEGDFGDPGSWRSAVSLGLSDVEWAPAKVDRVALGVELKGGPAAVTLRAERSGAVVDVKATTDLGGVEMAGLADVGADVEATVTVVEVGDILKDYVATDGAEDAEPVPVSGALDLEAKARVEAKKLAGATVTLGSSSLVYGETGLGTLSVDAETGDGEVIVATVGLVLDEATRVDVEGRYEVLAKAYSGKAAVAADLAGRLRALLGEFGVEQMLEGKATVAWEGRGELEPKVHRGKADVTLDGGKVDEGLEFDLKLDAGYDGTDVEIGEFSVVSEELRLRGGLKFADAVLEVSPIEVRDTEREIVGGHVRVPLDLETVKSAGDFFAQPGELDVALKSDSLPLASLMRLAGTEPPVTGVLDFDIGLAGPPRALAGEGSLAVVGVAPVEPGEVEVPPADVELGFAIGDAKLEVTGAVRHPQLNPLEVEAALAFLPEAWATGERKVTDEVLQASVKMEPSDLGFVKGYAAVIEVIEGALGIDVDVAGTVGAPVVTGTAGFELAEVRMANPGIPGVKDAVVRLRFAERVVEVEEFKAVVAGGELGLEGKVGLPPEGSGPEFDLRLTGKETLVTRNDMLSVRMNIDLALRGPYEAAALTGQLG